MRQNKTAKLISLTTATLLMALILASSFYLDGTITANVAAEEPPGFTVPAIKEINFDELKYFNEGWYELRNGYVFYLESFDSYVPLYIKVKNPSGLNGLLAVDAYGKIEFADKMQESAEAEYTEEYPQEQQESQNLITGEVSGMEEISGMQAAQTVPPSGNIPSGSENTGYILPNGQAILGTPPLDIKDYTLVYRYNGQEYRNIVTNKVLGDNLVLSNGAWVPVTSSTAPPAPPPPPGTPAPPAPPTAPSAPPAPKPTSQEIELGSFVISGKGVIETSDGKYYFQSCNTCKLQRHISGNDWDDVQRTFYFTATDSGGQSRIAQRDALTRQEASDLLVKEGFREVRSASAQNPTQVPAESASTGQFELSEDKKSVSNGRGISYFVTQGQNPQAFLDAKNMEAKINDEFNTWLRSQNLEPTPENRARFNKNPPKSFSDAEKRSIPSVLGLTPAQTGQQQAALPYTRIKLADGTWEFNYNGKPYYNAQDKAPKELESILSFNKNHPRAVEEKSAFITINDVKYKVYREGNNYIDETGNPITTSFQRTKTIGEGADSISVVETVDAKTKATTKIEATDKRGEKATLDRETLRQLELSGGKDAVFRKEGDKQKISFTDKNGNSVEITKSANYGEIKDGKITGTKTQEVFRTVFVDENGKYLTQQQAEELRKNGIPVRERTEQLSKQEEKDGKPTTYTIYTPRQVKRDGKYITIREARSVNRITGKREGYIYSEIDKDGLERSFYQDKDGKWFTDNGYEVTELHMKLMPQNEIDILNRAKKEDSQYKSRQFFANFERVFTEYRGLGYIPGLFMDEKKLLQWRHDVDKFFSENFLGIESWTSKICDEKIEHGQSQGVAYAETPQGLAQIGAHIEATRTQPIINLSDNTASYIYKITFNVRNGDYENDIRAPENMSINVIIKGFDSPPVTEAAERNTVKEIKLFKRNIKVSRGSSFGRMGSSAIVKESKGYYTRICIKFDQIPVKWKVDNKEICNIIKASPGEPTTVDTQARQRQQGSDADMNDF